MSLEKPRFRRDLEVRPVQTDGQSYVEVRDVAAGRSFLFYDFEYQVALAFDGLPLEKVIPWVKLATGLALQVEQLREFAQRLSELGFLEGEPTLDLDPSEVDQLVGSVAVPLDAEVPETVAPSPAEAPERVAPSPTEAPETVAPEQVATPSFDEAPPKPEQQPASDVPPIVDRGAEPEQRVQNAEYGDASEVAKPEPVAESAQPTTQPAWKSDAVSEENQPPREETPGPPDPDSVVMHPSEVVGETPTPVSLDRLLARESVPEQPRLTAVGAGFPAEAGPATPPRSQEPAPAEGAEAAGRADAPEGAIDLADQAAAPDPGAEVDASLLGDERESVVEAILHKAPPPDLAPTGLEDSTAFPVLPATRSAAAETPPPAGPPPWMTPRPLTTPRPVTLGPLVDRPSVRRRTRRSLVLFGTLGVLAAAALLAVVLPFVFSSRRSGPISVRTLSVTPGAVYRYFEGAAPIAPMPGPVLTFPAGGKVTRIVGKGSTVAVGDVVAAVEAARGLQTQLTHQRERLAYYRQMTEAMHQVGNSKEEERQLAKLEAHNAAIAKTLRDLANVAVIASAPGEVDESFVHEGQVVEADSPAVRLRSPGFRVVFELPRAQAALARRLGFCQVEVEGYLLDCSSAQVAGDEIHVMVDLASVPPGLVGKPAHLARARYSSAAVVPAAALQPSGSRVGVFLVSGNARLEMRPVVVADRDEIEAIVVQGLDVGDRVVVQPTLGLRPGMSVGSASGR